MANTYNISASYHANVDSDVEFPEGYSWDDVHQWYVKWDTLHVWFKNASDYVEFPLRSDPTDCIDWKRPNTVEVYSVDEDGEQDYENVVASA